MAPTAQVFASIADWAGLVGAIVACVGVALVYIQLRRATSASRAQATIQFQQAFHDSAAARFRLLTTFPIHEGLFGQVDSLREERARLRTWTELSELTDDEVADARAVIGAMNDVAQYVSDGLEMRSALQQYHTIFVRVGVLVLPYLDVISASVEGRPQTRFGRRMVTLYNAGIAYHLRHPKHRGRELTLERPVAGTSKKSGERVKLTLIDTNGGGVREHPGFSDESADRSATLTEKLILRRAVRRAERKLRR